MKNTLSIFVFLACIVCCHHSYADDPDLLVDPVQISPPFPKRTVGDLPVTKVYPATRENCEGWVRLGFEDKQDIYKGELEVLDSKPPGKYDEEAINSLLKFLSTQVSAMTPAPLSKLKTTVDESGQTKSIYTYKTGCDNREILE